MSPRGRLPLSRNVFDFTAPSLALPESVLLDTCFVASALVVTEASHVACRDFLVRVGHEEVVLYFSRLLELELAETAFKLAVIQQHGRKSWPAKRTDGRVRRRAGRLCTDLMAAWSDLLKTVPHLCIELQEVSGTVPTLMSRFGLASGDATHVASALYADAGGIVTIDAGFGCVPAHEIALFVDPTRLRSVRRRRGGR